MLTRLVTVTILIFLMCSIDKTETYRIKKLSLFSWNSC